MEEDGLPEYQWILWQPVEILLQLKTTLMRRRISNYSSMVEKRIYNTALKADWLCTWSDTKENEFSTKKPPTAPLSTVNFQGVHH